METGPFQDPQKVSASDAFFEPFGATWPIWGATWAQLGAKWRPKGPKMGSQIVQNRCQNRCKNRCRKSNEKYDKIDQKMMRKLIKNRCQKAILQKVLFFVRKATHFEDPRVQNLSKIDQKSTKNRPQIDPDRPEIELGWVPGGIWAPRWR